MRCIGLKCKDFDSANCAAQLNELLSLLLALRSSTSPLTRSVLLYMEMLADLLSRPFIFPPLNSPWLLLALWLYTTQWW